LCGNRSIVFNLMHVHGGGASAKHGVINLVKMPKFTNVNEALPDGILAWDAVSKTTDATNGQPVVRLAFSFTNGFFEVYNG